jgi:hypothetical protein
MSSRNAYLNAENRAAATVLYRAPRLAGDRERSPASVQQVIEAMRAGWRRSQARAAGVRRYLRSRDLRATGPRAGVAGDRGAAGTTRLIDNFLLRADGIWNQGVTVEQREAHTGPVSGGRQRRRRRRRSRREAGRPVDDRRPPNNLVALHRPQSRESQLSERLSPSTKHSFGQADALGSEVRWIAIYGS